ncbi:MAG: hypothetical protein R3B68_14750 [Phycisphaerales bacterium]
MRRDIMMNAGIALASTMFAGLAHAQPSALVATGLTDPTSGTPVSSIAPGQTVRVRTIVSWDLPGSQLAGIAGDLLATPLVSGGADGLVSGVFSEFDPGGTIVLGAVVGDDVLGLDVAPVFCLTGLCHPVAFQSTGIALVGYDWTAPATPGDYRFGFAPAAGRESVRIYETMASPAFSLAATTYTPATLTVVPAPGVLLVGGAAAVFAPRRSRRPFQDLSNRSPR